MTDEEKKAIEYWKTHMEILHWNTQLASEHYIKVLLDLIEKQSKEIEELKREKAIYYYEWRHLEANVINKIQEYNDKGMTVNLTNRSAGKTFQQAVHYEVKQVLQSLLRKE